MFYSSSKFACTNTCVHASHNILHVHLSTHTLNKLRRNKYNAKIFNIERPQMWKFQQRMFKLMNKEAKCEIHKQIWVYNRLGKTIALLW